MGLLSAKTLTYMGIGAGKRMLSYMADARDKGEKGLAELKAAKDEVNEEVAKLKKDYDAALTVGANVGGGTFANYLFGTNEIEYLSALSTMAPDDRNDAISQLKQNFEKLSPEAKAQFEGKDYKEFAGAMYEKDINLSKVKNGLQITNNMGSNTTNFLSRMMFEAPKDIKKKQEEVVSGFAKPELTTAEPIKGAYETISPATSKIKVDQGDILSYLKNSIDTFGFDQQDTRAIFETDYKTLITGSPQEKATVVKKYFDAVYQTKVPITMTSTSSPDTVEDWEDYFKPNYTDNKTDSI